MDTPSRYALLSRAAQSGTGCVNGILAPERGMSGSMSSYDRRFAPFLSELIEGGTIIDKWNVPEQIHMRLVISGPMVKAELADDAVDLCPEIPSYMLAPGGLEGGFRDLAQIKKDKPQWTGMDFVSIKTFTEIWREAGARIGKRVGSQILWEDGGVDPIPPKGSRTLIPCDERTVR